jgi:pimeloyl-ACP methyl ester carboxylesterase
MPEDSPPLDAVCLEPAPPEASAAGVQRLSYRSPQDGVADWALVWPPAGGNTWLVNLHGHGSDGTQLFTRPDIRGAWLPLFREMEFGILTPNLRGNAWMSPDAAADLRALLQVVRDDFGVSRFLFVSGSMGGTGNLIYAVLHPDDVAGVIAMCPATHMGLFYEWCNSRPDAPVLTEISAAIRAAYGGTPGERPDVYGRHSCLAHADRLTMPVYVAHGEDDAAIPVAQSRALAAACTSGNLKYREVPGDHDAPLALPLMEEGLQWILRSA